MSSKKTSHDKNKKYCSDFGYTINTINTSSTSNATNNNNDNTNRQNKKHKYLLICKEEFIRFCENTTIRGVPRIVKSPTRNIRYFWLSFFILFFIGFLICIIFLYFQYKEYDVIHPPRILSDQKAPFPSFTVCNFRSLARDSLETMYNMGIHTPREFAHSINKYAIRQFYVKGKIDLYYRASSAMNMGGYLESVPNHTYVKLGHKQSDFIIHCQVTYMEGSSPRSNRCQRLGEWRQFVHPQFINCYTFNLFSNFTSKTNTIELFLYLDEIYAKKLCIDCFQNDVKSQLAGAVILIHPRLTYPNFNHDTINLRPGTLTEIKLKIFHNIHKQHPYGRCSYKAPRNLTLYNQIYRYSEHACKELTIQKDINEHCYCNVIEKPISNFNLPFCTNLPHFIALKKCHDTKSDFKCIRQLNALINRLKCKASIYKQYDKDIIEQCPLSCDIYSYESDRSTSSWPTKSWQLKWMSSSVAQTLRNKTELAAYIEAYKKYIQGQVDEAFDILNKQTILEERLLAIMINKPNYNVHLVEEKEVLSLTSFLSQAGGLFSMWIGLTLISIVELLEMIINTINKVRLISKVKKQNRNNESNDGSILYNTYYTMDDFKGMSGNSSSFAIVPNHTNNSLSNTSTTTNIDNNKYMINNNQSNYVWRIPKSNGDDNNKS